MPRPRIERLLVASPLQWSFERTARRRLTVLAYHGVPEHDAETFASQMRWIAAHRHPIDESAALDVIDAGPVPDGAVLVTFDDGDPSIASTAAPILASLGIPALAFVNPGVIGTDSPQWWDEATDLFAAGGTWRDSTGDEAATADVLVRTLKSVPDHERRLALDALRATAARPAARRRQLQPGQLLDLVDLGVSVGNHGMTHALLDRCDAETARHEITAAHVQLTTWLGAEPRSFAYPSGNLDPRITAVLAGTGYRAAFAFDHHLADGPAPDRWAVSRLRVNSDTQMGRFRAIVSGLHPALHTMRRRTVGRRGTEPWPM